MLVAMLIGTCNSYAQLSDEQLRAAGIAPDLIRFSVGLEDPEDIIEDLEQALQTAKKA